MTNQLGGWSVSWQGVFGAGHVCCMGHANQIPPGTTVLKGIQAADAERRLRPGPGKRGRRRPARPSAYVVAVGEKAYAEGLGDNPAPALPADQQALITALEDTGKPVIVVVIAGRPVGLGPAEKADGVLMAYQGSTEAGQAVADVIFGKVNPSGKLRDQLAVGRADGRRRLRRRLRPHRSVTSRSSSTSCRGPAPGRGTPTTRCTRSDTACPTRRSRSAT